MSKLIEREPWWATRPEPGQTDAEVNWGWLEHYDDGTFIFVNERPTDEEIRQRKSCRLISELSVPAADSKAAFSSAQK